ncbi:MAG: hypothetical protein QXO51_04335 [Halobacteria archaeon]
MRIVVLGGAGDMGRQVCKELAASPEVSEIAVADISLDRAQEVAKGLGSMARAARRMERLEEVRIAFTGDAQDAEGLANVEHALHMFTGEVAAHLGGKPVRVRAGTGREIVEFPPPVGPVPVYYAGHAEPVTLPRFIPGLQTVTLKGGITPPWRATSRSPESSPPRDAWSRRSFSLSWRPAG